MNFLIWLIVGGILGWLASLVMKTDGQQGILLNVIVGIVGAFIGGWLISPMVGTGTINDGFFVVDQFASPTIWVDIPASYHNGACGLSFADGHAEIRRWRDPVILAQNSPINSPAGQSPPTDLNWLQERSTVRK